MSNIITVAEGVSFHLAEIHGHVTGHVHADNGRVVVFGRAWRQPCAKVESWTWIDQAKFDEIVGMAEIRRSMGWRD